MKKYCMLNDAVVLNSERELILTVALVNQKGMVVEPERTIYGDD